MTRFRIAALASSLTLTLGAAAWMDFFYAPTDDLQGPVQRIFYLHVSSAMAAFTCFAVVAGACAVYLWRTSARADRLARAGASVGLLLTSVTFGMGTIWGKAVWGWDPTKPWDARLTSTAVLWVIYAGYLLVRRFATPGRSAARLSAIVGIIGFFDVPIVYGSVYWWRTLHPGPVLGAPGGPALPAPMLQAFGVTVLAVFVLAGTLLAARYRIEVLRDRREAADGEAAAVPLPAAPQVAR